MVKFLLAPGANLLGCLGVLCMQADSEEKVKMVQRVSCMFSNELSYLKRSQGGAACCGANWRWVAQAQLSPTGVCTTRGMKPRLGSLKVLTLIPMYKGSD